LHRKFIRKGGQAKQKKKECKDNKKLGERNLTDCTKKKMKNSTRIYAGYADLGRIRKNASVFDFALKSIYEVNLKSVFFIRYISVNPRSILSSYVTLLIMFCIFRTMMLLNQFTM